MRAVAVSWLVSLAFPCHLAGQKYPLCASLRMLVPKSIFKQIDQPSKSFQACEIQRLHFSGCIKSTPFKDFEYQEYVQEVRAQWCNHVMQCVLGGSASGHSVI